MKTDQFCFFLIHFFGDIVMTKQQENLKHYVQEDNKHDLMVMSRLIETANYPDSLEEGREMLEQARDIARMNGEKG